jgi:serine/threonine protein kinase
LQDYEALQVLEQLTQALLYIHHGVSLVEDSLKLAAASPVESQSSPDDLQAGWVTILHRDIKPTNGKLSYSLAASN